MGNSLSRETAVARGRKGAVLPLLAVGVLAWVVVVLALYYRQLWRLLIGSGWESLGAEVIPARAFVAGMVLLAGTFVAFLLVARDRPAAKAGRTRVLVYAAVLVLGLGLLLLVNLLAGWRSIDLALPYRGEALRRELTGVAGALLLVTAALACGLGVSRVVGWRFANWRERISFAAALGVGILSFVGLALALFGVYRPGVLQAVIALVLLGTAVAVGVQVGRAVQRGDLHLAGRTAARFPAGCTRIWIACTALALLCAATAALAPESQYDALWWHLTYPQRYLAAGHLVDITHDFVSLYPMTMELWYGYGLVFGGSTAAVLLHFACLPLLAILTYEFARRYVPTASPWLAVALLVTAPTALWVGTTANTDLAIMLFVLLALYAVLRYVDGRHWQWLALAALSLGLALCTKHLALFAVALLCPMLGLLLLRRSAGWGHALGAAVVLGAVSLLVAAPWYVRSYLASGNPVFETMYSVFGAPPERWNALTADEMNRYFAQFGRPRTPLNLLTLPWDMTIHASRYAGSFGPVFLILLPMLALRRLRGVVPWLSAFAALWIALWALPISGFEVRQVLPIVPVLAVLAAAAFGRATALAQAVARRRGPAMLAASLGVLLVLNLPPFTFLHEVDRVVWKGWLAEVLHDLPVGVVIGGQSVDDYLTREVRSYPVWKFADATLPPTARVLTWSSGDQLYTRHDRIWANAAPIIAATKAPAGQEAQVLAQLRRQHVTHLIVDKRPSQTFPEPWDTFAVTGALARAHWYEQMYEDHWFVLYRIRWEAIGGQ